MIRDFPDSHYLSRNQLMNENNVWIVDLFIGNACYLFISLCIVQGSNMMNKHKLHVTNVFQLGFYSNLSNQILI